MKGWVEEVIMSDPDGNTNGTAWKKKFFLVSLLLVLSIFQAGAEQKPEQSIGVYTGWSFGLGDVFIDTNDGGHTSNHYKPNFILGAYWQHNFSKSFGLQLNINYQNCSNHWKFHYWDQQEEGTDSKGSYSFNLNGIFNLSRSAMTQFYLLGGIGILAGTFENVGSIIQFSGGTGIKLRVKPGSLTSVNLAAVFHHLLYNSGRARHADYLRLQAGLEFLLKKKQDNP
jgi:hypothetical protein